MTHIASHFRKWFSLRGLFLFTIVALYAPTTSAQQAISLDGADDVGLVTLPAAAPYNSVGDFELVFRMRDARVNHPVDQLLLCFNSYYSIRVNGTGDWISVQDSTSTGEDAYIHVSTHTYFKVRHVQATGVTTLEGWDADGGNYEIRRMTGAATYRDLSGTLGFGRSPASWDTTRYLQAKVDWLRWKSTVGSEGVPPSNADTAYDLLRWEFEGNGNDSSSHTQHLTLSGSPAFVSDATRGISLNGVDGGGLVTLPNSPPYNSVGDFELAFRMRDARVNHTADQFIFCPNNDYSVRIGAYGDWLSVHDSTAAEDAYIHVSTHTYFKVRHVQATGITTLEGWDADGGTYEIRRSTGATTARDISGLLGFGRGPAEWDTNRYLQAKVDWLRWKSTVGPEAVRPSDFNTDYDLLRWEFEGDGQDSSTHGLNLQLSTSPAYVTSPAATHIRPVARAGNDQTVKPGALVTLDGSSSASSEGNATYSWQQVGGAQVTLSNTSAVSPTFTAPTPSGDRDCHVFRLTVTDAGGTSTSDVYVGVVKTGANDEVVIGDPKVRLIVGPQLMSGSPLVPYPKFDEIEYRRGRANGELFPNIAPHVIAGTVSATGGSRAVTGVGTHFTQEIEMDPLVSTDFRGRLRISDGSTMREVEVESIQDDTHLTLKAAWGYTNSTNATADTYYAVPGADNSLNSSYLETRWNYYDTAYTMYIEYYRTGNTRFLGFARKAADVWWSSNFVRYGIVFEGSESPGGRNMAMAGLILRALDGKPQYWDYINRMVRSQFNNWVLQYLNRPDWVAAPRLYYDTRETGYAQLYAVMLSQVLPDSYPLYPNGTNNPQGGMDENGLAKRQEYARDVDRTAVEFFGRTQNADGSWLWDNDEVGAMTTQSMQPFMVGLYMEAAILQHQVTANQSVKDNLRDQIVKACTHLKNIWRSDAVPGRPGVSWRGHWGYYHGTLNGNSCATGCGNQDPNAVSEVRHLNSTVQHAIGYAYQLTGDPSFKEHGDNMLNADFSGADGIYGQADTPDKPKDYNMNYRGAGRYLVWRLTTPPRAISLDGVDDVGLVTLPAAPYNSVGDFELVFRMRDARVNHPVDQLLFCVNGFTVRVNGTADWISANDSTATGEDAYIHVSTHTYFKVRHVQATGVTTLEGWDADGGNYEIRRSSPGATTARDFSGPLAFGRSSAEWDTTRYLQAKVDWLRWKSGVGAENGKPSDIDTAYDLLRLEFEGGGSDSSTHGLNLTLSGSPAFVNSP